MKSIFTTGIVLYSFIFIVSILFVYSPVFAYYGCGTGPCTGPPIGGGADGAYPCNASYYCKPNPGGVCGVPYNQCSGTTCNANTGFDSSTCTTGNQCNNAGTTNTAGWTYGACTTNCGSNTRVGTCTCSTVNNCPAAACTSPAGACSATYSDSTCACVSQDPQTAPASVTATQVNDGGGVPIRQASISWTYPSMTAGCGNDWGYNCSGNSNDFILRYDGGVTTETEAAASGSITHSSGLFAWGAHSVIVCARNGFGEKCTAASVPFTLTAPTCSVSGQTSDPACRNTDPPLSASYGNNADQIQFLVKKDSSTLAPAYAAQSAWLSSNPAPYTPSLATGTYYWNVYSQSTISPVACVTPVAFPTGIQLNIDKTPPSVPGGTSFTLAPDGSCLNKYFVSYQWGASIDTGCASVPITYQADIATDVAHASPVVTSWTGARKLTTSSSYFGNTVLYGRAQALDNLSNLSGWSADAGTPVSIPTPSPYPTIHLSGNYIEDIGSCSSPGEMVIDPSTIMPTLTFSNPAGVTYTCNMGPAGGSSSYSCDITIDNQIGSCVAPDHNISLNVSYSGYPSVDWRSPDNCGGTSTGQSFNAETPGSIAANLYFKFDITKGWFKTSSTSFVNKTARANVIPNTVVAFDETDDTSKHVIAGGAGIVSKSSTLNLGANAWAGGQVEYSSNNWSSPNYATNSIFTPSKFTDYVKSRKKYATITTLNEITEDGIYYTAGDLTINSSAVFDNKKVVIIADKGIVTIGVNLIPTNGSVAVIADRVVIADAVTEVDGIIIGNNVAVNDGAVFTNKLKIDGNLIHLSDTLSFTNTRVAATPRSPSLYVKFNQAIYLNLLPYLSVSLYDWRQLQ